MSSSPPPGSSDPIIAKKGYQKKYNHGECRLILTLYGEKIRGGYKDERILHLIWVASRPGMLWTFDSIHIHSIYTEILYDSYFLKQLADILTEDENIVHCETRIKDLGFVLERN